MSNRKSNIPVRPNFPPEKIKFSFEYYDASENTKYCLSDWSKEQIKEALSRLKDINTKTFKELNTFGRRVYHFGEVYWERTVEKSGFPDPRLKYLSPFHFALLGVNGQLTRVYGAYSSGTFYIVWFDLNHEIWPSTLKNT